MELGEALGYSFGRIQQRVHGVVEGLDAEAILWRPDPAANSIAWLLWHLTRIQDDHVSEIAGRQQVWVTDALAERFGLPAGAMDTGYGHTAEQVAAIRPPQPQLLIAYYDDVAAFTRQYLETAPPADYDRIIDRSYDPPVSVGIRLMSVNGDALQHVGQASYLRGLLLRRTGGPGG